MPHDEVDAMAKTMQLVGQFLPAIMLNVESKIWNDFVLAFVKAGDSADTAIQKADYILQENRSRFGSDKLKDQLLEGAPKADLRAIR